MKNLIILCFFCLILVHWAKAQDRDLDEGLPAGVYPAGFSTFFLVDPSRPNIYQADLNERIIGEANHPGRPLQLNVWYPAINEKGKTKMRFKEYVHLLAQEVDFSPLNQEREELACRIFVQNTQNLGSDSAFQREKLNLLLEKECRAVKKAGFATGKFPLVIFPDYPATQSILCEFLATQGFVVVSTSLKGSESTNPEISVDGIETQVRDLEFVLAWARSQSFVDADKVALLGLGFNATSCLALMLRNPLIDALISLEGGILTQYEKAMLAKTPYFEKSRIHQPILAIYAPHPSINPELISDYKYAPQYLVYFPKMSEFYFLNYGMMEKLVPGIIGQPPGDTAEGFRRASQYVLAFLQWQLKQENKGEEYILQNPANRGIPPAELQVSQRKALPAPPSLREVKNILLQQGAEAFRKRFDALRKQDPQPFSPNFYLDLTNWLFWKRDEDQSLSKLISEMRLESYPASSRAAYTLALICHQRLEKEKAIQYYRQTLDLLEKDDDPQLDPALRQRIRENAEKALRDLSIP